MVKCDQAQYFKQGHGNINWWNLGTGFRGSGDRERKREDKNQFNFSFKVKDFHFLTKIIGHFLTYIFVYHFHFLTNLNIDDNT